MWYHVPLPNPMKRITIIVDDVDLPQLRKVLLEAHELHIEDVGGPTPKRRRLRPSAIEPLSNTHYIILSHYTPDGEFTLPTARKWMEDFHYSPNSASPAASRLIKDGYLKRLPHNRFKFIHSPPTNMPKVEPR